VTIEEYQNTLRVCAMLAGLVGEHDIPKMLEMIERADSIGGMIDPTLYREKHGAMMEDKELLEAALPLWRIAKKFQERLNSAAKAPARL
jgi:hypothetical protein